MNYFKDLNKVRPLLKTQEKDFQWGKIYQELKVIYLKRRKGF